MEVTNIMYKGPCYAKFTFFYKSPLFRELCGSLTELSMHGPQTHSGALDTAECCLRPQYFTSHFLSVESVLSLKRVWLDNLLITNIDNLEMLGFVTHLYLQDNNIASIEVTTTRICNSLGLHMKFKTLFMSDKTRPYLESN